MRFAPATFLAEAFLTVAFFTGAFLTVVSAAAALFLVAACADVIADAGRRSAAVRPIAISVFFIIFSFSSIYLIFN